MEHSCSSGLDPCLDSAESVPWKSRAPVVSARMRGTNITSDQKERTGQGWGPGIFLGLVPK